jgi:hypothetical protein
MGVQQRAKEAAEAAGRNVAMWAKSSGGSLERLEDLSASGFIRRLNMDRRVSRDAI